MKRRAGEYLSSCSGAVFSSCCFGWQQLLCLAAEQQRWRKSWRSFVWENRQTVLESVQTLKEGQERSMLSCLCESLDPTSTVLFTHWRTDSTLKHKTCQIKAERKHLNHILCFSFICYEACCSRDTTETCLTVQTGNSYKCSTSRINTKI